VVTVAARNNHQVAGVADIELREDFFVLSRVDFGRFGKALAIGECFAIVDDYRSEPGDGCDFGDGAGNVSRSEKIQPRRRNHRLHEDTELSAADQAVVVSGVLPEVEREMLRTLRLQHLARRVPYLRLDAAAAYGPYDRAVLAHQQLGALVTGDG